MGSLATSGRPTGPDSEEFPLRVLVAHASAHGSTAEIATRLARAIAAAGPDVDVRAVADVASLSGYDAAVIGSAIHDGAWLPDAHEFLRTHKAALAKRPTWLFSVSSVGATSSAYGGFGTAVQRKLRRDPRAIYEARQALGHVDHHDFAGVLTAEGWKSSSIRLMKILGGSFGDHRDWDDVDAWGTTIGEKLATGEAHAG
jgi:menaquinone-dependent protoporphyrinogen oxidase